jgi:hypothetical protein
MRKWFLFGLAAFGLLFGSGQTWAGPVFYTSQGAFNAATQGLSTQTFDGVAANVGVGPGGGIGVDNPLNSISNSAMLPGLTITGTTNSGGDIAVVGPNFAGTGLANYSVFSNYGAGLSFQFGSGVSAASLNVLTEFSSAYVNLVVNDTLGNQLATYTVTGAPNTGAGEFIGVTSNGANIGSLVITAPGAPFPGVDQVEFGQISSVPEPASISLFGIAALGWIGARRLRRRNA